MSISLYNIEDALQQLVELREQAEIEGDSEALKVIDDQLAEYLKNEAAKIDSYAGIIRQLGADAALVKAEADRLYDRAKAMEARRDAIKAAALAAMQAHDIKALKTASNTLRRQGNGGVQPLDIAAPEVPEQYQEVIIKMSMRVWRGVARTLSEVECREVSTRSIEIDTNAIREALKQYIKCPECGGAGYHVDAPIGETGRGTTCARCGGEGTIPNSIPGVKLLPKGEHLRVE